MLLPMFPLDFPAFLLLKSRKNSDMTFFLAEISDKGHPRCNFKSGESDYSFQKLTFQQCQTVLDPHSELHRD